MSILDSLTLRATYLKSNDFLYPTVHEMISSVPGAALSRWMDTYKLTKKLNKLHGKYMRHMGMEPLRSADLRWAVSEFTRRFQHPQIHRLALLLPLVYSKHFREIVQRVNKTIAEGPVRLTPDKQLELLTAALNRTTRDDPDFRRGHLVKTMELPPSGGSYPYYKRTDFLRLTTDEVADILLIEKSDFTKGPWLVRSMVGILLEWVSNRGPGILLRGMVQSALRGDRYNSVMSLAIDPYYLEHYPRLKQLYVTGAEPLLFYRWAAGERGYSGRRTLDVSQEQIDNPLNEGDQILFNTVAAFLQECDQSQLPPAKMVSPSLYELTVREHYAEHAVSIRQQLKYLIEYAEWAYFHNPIA